MYWLRKSGLVKFSSYKQLPRQPGFLMIFAFLFHRCHMPNVIRVDDQRTKVKLQATGWTSGG